MAPVRLFRFLNTKVHLLGKLIKEPGPDQAKRVLLDSYTASVVKHNEHQALYVLPAVFQLRPLASYKKTLDSALKLTRLLAISTPSNHAALRSLYQDWISPLHDELAAIHKSTSGLTEASLLHWTIEDIKNILQA